MTKNTVRREIGRPLDVPFSVFDIQETLLQIRSEEEYSRTGHNAIILHKEGGLKVVVIALRAGQSIPSHQAKAPITVQVLEGRLRFNAGEKSSLLKKESILTLHSALAHDITAMEDSAFLLTLAGPRLGLS